MRILSFMLVASLACCGCSEVKRPQQRMKGLWLNDFEGSQFCPSPAKSCEYVMSDKRQEPVIWLEFSGPLPERFRAERLGGLYEVEFLGRRSAFKGSYGHMGMFDEEVVVDRMISIKELEPRRGSLSTLISSR